ncbi:MAG: Pr6Pr family membrane protein [Chitinophagaceae bacterium]
MTKTGKGGTRLFMILVALVAWFAVMLQLVLIIDKQPESGLSMARRLVDFLSFFTVQCNILVAVSLTLSVAVPNLGIGRFFSKPSVNAALAIYILVVGIVYNVVLRSLWKPEGWQAVADNALHLAVPVLYLIFWLFFVHRRQLTWKSPISWLVFPFLYLAYSLLRGGIVHVYPYPFIDVNLIGYPQTFINAGLLFIGFIVLGFLFVAFDKLGKTPVEK